MHSNANSELVFVRGQSWRLRLSLAVAVLVSLVSDWRGAFGNHRLSGSQSVDQVDPVCDQQRGHSKPSSGADSFVVLGHLDLKP